MKIESLRKVERLVEARNKMIACMHELNNINGGELLSIPPEVLTFVDTQDAARGLLSLLLPEITKVEAELTSLGVEW